MKRYAKKISLMLAVVCFLVIPLSAFAATGTSYSNYTASLLSKWKGYGVVDKSYSSLDLNKPIEKIDFIKMLNAILKTSKKADINFTDVHKNSWYGQEIAKAAACGYISNKENTKFYPFSNITRVEAAEMVSYVFGLELKNEKILSKIADGKALEKKQLNELAAVIEKGGLTEVASGRYAPTGVLKLKDALIMLDKCVGQIALKSGTIKTNAAGNMFISVGAVTLRGISISGDLIIGEGVGDGVVTLESVKLAGRLIIRGGGPNGVIIKNSQIGGNLIVEKSAGNVYIRVVGSTTIKQAYLKSGCTIEEGYLTSGDGFVNITALNAAFDGQNAILKGDFKSLTADNSNINLKLSGNAENVSLNKDSQGIFSLLSGTVKTVSAGVTKQQLEFLGGKVTTMNISKDAKGNKITINGPVEINTVNIESTTEISFKKGTVNSLILDTNSQGSYISMQSGSFIRSFVIMADAEITGYGKIESAYSYANNVKMGITPSFYSYKYVPGWGNDDYLPSIGIGVPGATNDEITIQEGKSIDLYRDLNLSVSPDKSTVGFVSLNGNVATVSDKGLITAIEAGYTKIYITGQYSGYSNCIKRIDVNVTPGNVTLPGRLEISPVTGEAATVKDFEITYTSKDDFSNGTVTFWLPDGFPAFETDTVKIGNGTEVTLNPSQRLNVRTLSFTNLNLSKGQKIIVKLRNKTVPQGGEYVFSAVTDADGTGPKVPTSGQDERTVFTSDKLKTLLEVTNYTLSAYDAQNGAVSFTKLSFAGFTGATKWLIAVQDGEFTHPGYDDLVSGTEYTVGSAITIAPNQHLMLAAVDGDSMAGYKVKAFVDITVH
ncbi:BslA/BslB family hydrophobin [Ruminiclostridium cellulolyticum]|uniref:S-layer domain protein n=1 Tax=Ruminiclostridium cellulolyticum (strain ATCC 35319 / DSM 5812 / JCM 6584 / H10) TaxID=394503 RepID=B8I582_RUMCH|nr:BslA/BslB family hydrophobin [Ruminiclostridium cellulolyticum]ACL74662.1 S-layer domain protein [Ruminiclostridium cellulolyticum H10]